MHRYDGYGAGRKTKSLDFVEGRVDGLCQIQNSRAIGDIKSIRSDRTMLAQRVVGVLQECRAIEQVSLRSRNNLTDGRVELRSAKHDGFSSPQLYGETRLDFVQ